MSARTTVRERYRAFDRWRGAGIVKGIVGFAFLALLPQLVAVPVFGVSLSEWVSIKILVLTLIFAFSAQAWNLMSGYTGQFSFGHAAFFGIGAYTTQALLETFHTNPWIGMVVGGVIASVYGLFIGFLCFRYELRGHYFALATLAFAELLGAVVQNAAELHGANGYYKPFAREYAAGPGLVAFQFTSDLPYYYVILAFLVVVTVVAWAVRNSWIGLYFFSIREDEAAAASVGVPTQRYKIYGVMLSAFFTAWGGAFWSMYYNTIQPATVFDLFLNVRLLLPAVVGGPGTLLGPIVGSLFVTPISEVLRTTFDTVNGLDQVVYGVVLVLIVLYSPKGIVNWPARFRALVGSETETDDDD